MINVKVVTPGENYSLVEYVDNGVVNRVSIPTQDIDDGLVEEETIIDGIEYGFPFDELEYPPIGPADISAALHKYSVWTAEDAKAQPNQVRGAIMSLMAPLVKITFEAIRNK